MSIDIGFDEPLTLRNQQRDLTTCSIHVRAETLNEEERSVEAVLSTDTRAIVYDMQIGRVIEEVLLPGGAVFPTQIPLLESHSRWSLRDVLGSIREMRIEDNKLVGRLFFASGDEDSDRAWNKVQQGHLTDVSIGYKALDFVDIKPNTSQRVEGKLYTAGDRTLRVTRQYKVKEGSLVAIGADEVAKIRIDLPPDPKGVPVNKLLRKYLESLGLRADASEAEAQQYLADLDETPRAIADGLCEQPAAAPVQQPSNTRSEPEIDPDQVRRDAASAERSRIDYCRTAQVAGVSDDLVQRAINEEWNQDRVNREYLTAVRAARPEPVAAAPAIHIRSHEQDCNDQTLAAGLMLRYGCDPAPLCRTEQDRQSWEQRMNQGERYRSYSLMEMARESVRIHGARTPEGTSPITQDEVIRAALSTPTLNYAFTTSVHARLMAAYEEETATLDWVETVDVPNFKQNEAIGLGKGSDLELLPRGKTASDSTFSDEQETYRAFRFAKKFGVDDQDIIDDNLEVFQIVAPEMGAAAARIAPDMIFFQLLSNSGAGPTLKADNKAVFHTDHSNAGTAALDAAALKAAVTRMMLQQQDGVNLNISPRFLIVAPSLEFTARELINSSQILIATGSDTTLERGNANTLRDLGLQIRTDSRLENGVRDPITGNTATGASTKWYLASRPFRTVRLAYRTGTGRRPLVRQYTFSQGKWGIGWDINLDVGAAFIGYRGLQRGNT